MPCALQLEIGPEGVLLAQGGDDRLRPHRSGPRLEHACSKENRERSRKHEALRVPCIPCTSYHSPCCSVPPFKIRSETIYHPSAVQAVSVKRIRRPATRVIRSDDIRAWHHPKQQRSKHSEVRVPTGHGRLRGGALTRHKIHSPAFPMMYMPCCARDKATFTLQGSGASRGRTAKAWRHRRRQKTRRMLRWWRRFFNTTKRNARP